MTGSVEFLDTDDLIELARRLLGDPPVGAGNCVVAGQAAFRYSLMSPSQRAVLTTWRSGR